MSFDRDRILREHFAAQIAADYDVDAIAQECRANAEPGEDGDELVGRCFLGTVFAVMPSGKYYMPWTSNQTRSDETRDGAYMEALEDFLSQAGCWLESGEGDPCDMFAAMIIELEKEEQS
jgi:hypothetical protein